MDKTVYNYCQWECNKIFFTFKEFTIPRDRWEWNLPSDQSQCVVFQRTYRTSLYLYVVFGSLYGFENVDRDSDNPLALTIHMLRLYPSFYIQYATAILCTIILKVKIGQGIFLFYFYLLSRYLIFYSYPRIIPVCTLKKIWLIITLPVLEEFMHKESLKIQTRLCLKFKVTVLNNFDEHKITVAT